MPALDGDGRGGGGDVEQATLAGDEGGIERFRERDVGGVVAAEVLPEFPNAGEQRSRREAVERQLVQVGERLGRTSFVGGPPPSTCLRKTCATSVSSRWGAASYAPVAEPLLDPVEVRLVAEQEVERGRGVEHDHHRVARASCSASTEASDRRVGRACAQPRRHLCKRWPFRDALELAREIDRERQTFLGGARLQTAERPIGDVPALHGRHAISIATMQNGISRSV